MLSNRLSQLREERGLTRKKVAEILNIDQSTYGNYELSKRQPDYTTLEKLAAFYDVSIDYLLGRTDERNITNNIGNFIIGERIKKIREEKGISQLELAEKTGISQKELHDIENGLKAPSLDTVQSICSAIGITVTELIRIFPVEKSEIMQIPRISDVMAKDLFNDKNVLELIATNKCFLDKYYLSDNFQYFYYEVPDDSMNTEFPRGSIILVQCKSIAASGDIILVTYNGKSYIRQFHIHHDTITLMSRSSYDVPPIIININTDKIQIIGKIIMTINLY